MVVPSEFLIHYIYSTKLEKMKCHGAEIFPAKGSKAGFWPPAQWSRRFQSEGAGFCTVIRINSNGEHATAVQRPYRR